MVTNSLVSGLNNAANRAGDDALEAEDKYHKKCKLNKQNFCLPEIL